jgi:hypothetical protein
VLLKWGEKEDRGVALDEDGQVELFETKERVRRLEGELEVWKERYHAASELVGVYERGFN